MSRARSFVLLASLLSSMSASAQAPLPACVRVEAVARWGADAYNHFVVLHNGCERAARCRVATDVSPEPQSVEVAAGGTLEVITFRGSPASTVTPRVSCELATRGAAAAQGT